MSSCQASQRARRPSAAVGTPDDIRSWHAAQVTANQLICR